MIDSFPEMKMFVLGSVSTPSLELVNYVEVKVDDLNKWIQQRNKRLVMATKAKLVMAEASDVYESRARKVLVLTVEVLSSFSCLAKVL
ncbi:hypothetical protein RND71_009569 [Anisodus tanguticus]|uniref:Uncharacterized protein n=1 Tax=Anisodus tanguticus TaxID=243964 RepID=A0AAE1SG29_9SOLA|nr:hypothetical protein RND71_009569 [Anisodus tanguticus]